MKKCRKCEREKDFEQYHKSGAGKDGFCHYCKECISKDRRAYLAKNKEKVYARQKKSRESNPERVKKYNKEYYEKHKETLRGSATLYNESNRQRINERQREYNEKNRDSINEKSRFFWRSEKGNVYANEYYHRTKEQFDIKIKARNKLRYAVHRGKIVKPGSCDLCLKECIPHGHHTDYGKPLEVIWVCTLCHKKLHR